MRTRAEQESAFLNIPYDHRYESIYLAFVAGLCAFGLRPRATIEIPGAKRRLERIIELIRGCRYSFHDLSRVQLDRNSPPTPRFNMPFELGLAVDWSLGAGSSHEWFVFESKPHRLSKSLSDLRRNRSLHSRRYCQRTASRADERSHPNDSSPRTRGPGRNLPRPAESSSRNTHGAGRQSVRSSSISRFGSSGAAIGSGANFVAPLTIVRTSELRAERFNRQPTCGIYLAGGA
jgi:hypothetical protein